MVNRQPVPDRGRERSGVPGVGGGGAGEGKKGGEEKKDTKQLTPKEER